MMHLLIELQTASHCDRGYCGLSPPAAQPRPTMADLPTPEMSHSELFPDLRCSPTSQPRWFGKWPVGSVFDRSDGTRCLPQLTEGTRSLPNPRTASNSSSSAEMMAPAA